MIISSSCAPWVNFIYHSLLWLSDCLQKKTMETIAEAWHSRCALSCNCQSQLFRFSESLGLRNPVQGYLINVHITALTNNDTKEGDATIQMTSPSCNWLSDCNSQIQLVGNSSSTPIYEIAGRTTMTSWVSLMKYQTIIFIMKSSDELPWLLTDFISSWQ